MLNLGYCKAIVVSDEAVIAISQGLKRLKSLTLAEAKISESAVLQLLALPDLETLDISSCKMPESVRSMFTEKKIKVLS